MIDLKGLSRCCVSVSLCLIRIKIADRGEAYVGKTKRQCASKEVYGKQTNIDDDENDNSKANCVVTHVHNQSIGTSR